MAASLRCDILDSFAGQGLKTGWYARQGGPAIRIIAFAASLNDNTLYYFSAMAAPH